MPDSPRITTIIPTFRRPRFLRRALDSVLLQTYPWYQVCVYDNASGDETAAVVAEYARRDVRIKYFVQPENIGAERNFRFGLDHAGTEFVSFLSDDDVVLPRLFELTVVALDSHPQAAMASTGVIHTNKTGTFAREPSLEPGVHEPPLGLAGMLRFNQPTWTGTLFRRRVVADEGGLDDETVIDLDLELRIAAHHPIAIIGAPGAVLTADNHFGKCLEWTGRFELTIRKLEGDESIPEQLRRTVRPSLEGRLKTMVFETGVVAARMGRADLAHRAAEVLDAQYGDRRRSLMVSAMALTSPVAPRLAPAYKRLRAAFGVAHLSSSENLRGELRAMAPTLIDRLSETSAA